MFEFEEVVNALKNALANDDRTMGRFVFGETQNTYVFVGDAYDIIGAKSYHYEIRNVNNNAFSVEFHLEGGGLVYQRFEGYVQGLQAQNINGISVHRRGANGNGRYFILSGDYLFPRNFTRESLVMKLKENLLNMESKIGNDLRMIIVNV